MKQVNLTEKQSPDWAIYLPAISGFLTTQFGYMRNIPDYVAPERIPAGFENGMDGLDFLDKERGYYYYKWGLYSAGHAERNLTKCDSRAPTIHGRGKETFILGDSGGFQVATGVIKTDWSKFKEPEGDKLREEILRYLEHTADYSMTLDIPAFAATGNFSKKTGLTKFEDTLDLSLHNLHYFVRNRVPGKTKFLNVLSGSSAENSKLWYDSVKAFSDPQKVVEMGYTEDRTLEGYAFAGINMRNMHTTLSRVLDLREDNLFAGKDWIHFLGLGRLDWACHLSAIMREIKKHDNPNLQISFDAASPFVATAYGQCYNYNSFSNKRFMYGMAPAPDNKKFAGNYSPMPYTSPIMDRLTLHDLCPLHVAHAVIEGRHVYDVTEEEVKELQSAGIDAKWVPEGVNKLGKTARTSWDTASYLMYMAHNVYKHIEAVQEANRVADVEYARFSPNWRDWVKDKKTSKSVEISEFVPHTVLYFRSFVEELLDPANPNPRQMLDDNRSFLDSISFGASGGSSFGSLFEFEDGAGEVDIDKFADMNDEKLTELEDDNK